MVKPFDESFMIFLQLIIYEIKNIVNFVIMIIFIEKKCQIWIQRCRFTIKSLLNILFTQVFNDFKSTLGIGYIYDDSLPVFFSILLNYRKFLMIVSAF